MILPDPRSFLPLQGPRLRLTPLEESDLPVLLPFFQDLASLTYYIPTTARPLNEPQMKNMLVDWNDGIENFVFAIRMETQLVGLINLDDLDWPNSHAEIGIAITDTGLRGQGLAAEAMQLLIDYAFNELGLHRLWARIIEDNLPSIHLFEKLGFQPEGRMLGHVRRRGKFRDMLVFGLIQSPK